MKQFSSDKILRHVDRIAQWQATGLSRPITYELDMTNLCNSRCSFCFGYAGGIPGTAHLTMQEARAIIRQIKKFGGKGLTFTGGGEPLCNPATLDAVVFARSLGLDIGFISNGILLDRRAAEVLVKACTWIRVSIDAGSAKTYKLSHGLNGDTFEKVLNNTRQLVEIKRLRGSKATIGTGFITFPEVTADMVPYVKISRELGVDYAQFRPLLKKFAQLEINRDHDLKILRQIERSKKLATPGFHVLCSEHKYRCIAEGTVRRAYEKCYGHHFAAVISADKSMYLCCHMRGRDAYRLGSLATHSLPEIWKSAQRKKSFESLKFSDCPLLCRCDGFNTLLWNISQKGEHENFL